MHVRILDLDGGLLLQQRFVDRHRPEVMPAREWGPRIRLACSFRRYRRFERALAGWTGRATDAGPSLTWYGSGDFHHVSLALVRRVARPFNLLILDNHPDWMRGVPFLHCGTWVYHAARLPLVRRIFHVGGEVDFDNHYRWMAPWKWLRGGKITVFPALRRLRRGPWANIGHEPLRPGPASPVAQDRLEELLHPFHAELARWPLYVSLDKDVLRQGESIVNWDSGHLTLQEVSGVLEAFLRAAGGRMAGMDVVGDWSPVRVQGLLRRTLHWTEHPPLAVDPAGATRLNEAVNLALVEGIKGAGRQGFGAALEEEWSATPP
jgi:hypothetical protein